MHISINRLYASIYMFLYIYLNKLFHMITYRGIDNKSGSPDRYFPLRSGQTRTAHTNGTI
jgi:hypothetical protein